MLPTISIVTPNLNGAATLRRTIDSVLQQEYPNLEYIIVDGNSTDDSHAIIDEYREHFAQVIVGTDRTLYDGVAKGFDVATGDVLAWLNSDDTYEPGALLRVGEQFGRHPDWAVIYFDDTVRKQGWRVANRMQKYVQLPELLRGHVIYQASTFFRRSAYEAVGGLERESLRLAGDYQLWLRLAAKYELHYVPGHASAFDIRPAQLSGDWNAYAGEMAAIRDGANEYLPPLFWLRSLPGMVMRKLRTELHARTTRHHYPLEHEERDWAAVEDPGVAPLSACRCPFCADYPTRLLFSSPDTRFGERTVRSMVHCDACGVAFLFPAPSETEMRELERIERAARPGLREPPPGEHSPHRRPAHRRYRLLGELADFLGVPDDELDPVALLDVHRHRDVLVVSHDPNSWLERLRARGFTHITGARKLPTTSYHAILLDSLARQRDPIAALAQLGERLEGDGRLYVVMPNLESAWVDRLGPAWAHWRVPYHRWVTGRRGLERMCDGAGLTIDRLWTWTDRDALALGQHIATRGLGAAMTGGEGNPPHTRGAHLVSRVLWDPQGRGDSVFARLRRS